MPDEPIEIKLDNKAVEEALLEVAQKASDLRPLMKNIAGKEMHCEELPRDKKAAFEIYDKMNGGELLFPDDYASRIATAIKNKYDQEKIINEDVFEDYCKEFALNPSKAKRYFNNLGYSVTYDKVESSEEEKNNMQEEIDTEIIPWINEFIMDANPYHLLKKKQ